MPSVTLSPVFNELQYFSNTGAPLSGGKIFAYQAGSFSSLQATYNSSSGSTPNANPIVLDSSGRANVPIWLVVNSAYNLVLTQSDGTTVIENIDNVTGITPGSGSFVLKAGDTMTGSLTSPAFIPNSATVPVNGMYLPGANTPAFTSNGVLRLQFSSTGAWGLAGATYGAAGQILTSNGSAAPPTWQSASGTGTVTSVSVTSVNGFAGTVTNPTSTPAISLSTTVTGILKGDGTSISAASIGDYPTFNQNTTGTAAGLSTTLPIASGGTGQVTASDALNALLPTQAGNNGKFLTTNGSLASWATASGTVTSVGVSGANGIGVSGSPITSSGTIALSLGAITPTSVTSSGAVSGSNLSGTNTGDQTITLTGDVTGSGTGSFATTLAASGVSANTYGSSTSIPTFVVDGKGRITSASGNAVIAPAGTLSGATLNASVTASSLTSVGTLGSLTVSGAITATSSASAFAAASTVGGIEIGFRNIPRSTTTTTVAIGDRAKCIALTAGITVPASVFAAGDAVTLYNDSGASVTITQGGGLTMRLAGTATTGNRTLAQRGVCTMWFNSTTECVISGGGLT
jgi:hypothetical protein